MSAHNLLTGRRLQHRSALAALALAALVALAVFVAQDGAPPAHAQDPTPVALVKNDSQVTHSHQQGWSEAFGVIIYTGMGNTGKTYTLTKVRVLQETVMSDASAFKAELWTGTDDTFVPGEKIKDLTITAIDGNVSALDLVAPEGTTLQGNTRYALVMYRLAARTEATWKYLATSSGGESGSLGWRLGNNRKATAVPPTSASMWRDPKDIDVHRLPKIIVYGYESAQPTVTLTSSDADNSVAESAGSVTLTATLSEAAGTGGVQVTLTRQSASTATVTSDYTLSSGTITIAENATTGTATLNIVDDSDVEDDETLVLSATASGHVAGSLTVTIVDDDTSMAAPPAAPAGVTSSPGAGRLDLTWTAPTGDVTGYDVEYKLSTAADQAALDRGRPQHRLGGRRAHRHRRLPCHHQPDPLRHLLRRARARRQ